MPPGQRPTRSRHEVLLAEHGDSPEIRRIVDQAVAFLARAEEAHAALVAHGGLTIQTGKGVFPHPAVTIERTARLGFLTAIRALRQKPKRHEAGRPGLGEVVLEAQQRAGARFFGTPRSRTATLHLARRAAQRHPPADAPRPAMYAIDEHTLRNWIKKGAIVATRLGPRGHTIRVSAEEVRKLGRETGRKAAS